MVAVVADMIYSCGGYSSTTASALGLVNNCEKIDVSTTTFSTVSFASGSLTPRAYAASGACALWVGWLSWFVALRHGGQS